MMLTRGQIRLVIVRHRPESHSMKSLEQFVCLVISILGAYLANAADLAATNEDVELPKVVTGLLVSPEVRDEANKLATLELRVAYLSSVIASNSVETNSNENYRKSSAIRLLGVIARSNSIAILVSNITFIDVKYTERPVYRALEAIGEPAVPYLLNALKEPSASPKKCDCVIEMLRIIKHAMSYPDRWQRFVDNEKETFPAELRSRIDRNIWINN